MQIMNIDGDEFAEADYGLVVDNSNATQEFAQKIDTMAQAALYNQSLHFSTIMKLYSSASLAEKQRYIERDEKAIQEQAAQAQQQQLQVQQQEIEQKAQLEAAKMQQENDLNMRDNETKIQIALINAQSKETGEEETFNEESKAKLLEQIRECDQRLKLDRDRLSFDKEKAKIDASLKEKQINKTNTSINKNK